MNEANEKEPRGMSNTRPPDDDHRPAHDRALDEEKERSAPTGPGDDRARDDRADDDRAHDDRAHDDRPREPAARETPFTQQLGRIFVAIIAVLFGIFAVANAQFVDFNWIFGETLVVQEGGERVSGGVPLIILLVVSFVLGALAGWFATWRRKRHHRGAA